MWAITTVGMFSAVQDKHDKRVVQVRTRAKEDALMLARWLVDNELVQFDKEYPDTDSLVLQWPGRDYPYRVLVWREHWARFLFEQSLAIDYTNFKDEVKRKQGARRAGIYGRIWGVLLDVTRAEKGYPEYKGKSFYSESVLDFPTSYEFPSLASRLADEMKKPSGAGLADSDDRCPRCDKFLSEVGVSADGSCKPCTAALDEAIEAEDWDKVQEISIEMDGAPAPF